jgi:hypothetical protein
MRLGRSFVHAKYRSAAGITASGVRREFPHVSMFVDTVQVMRDGENQILVGGVLTDGQQPAVGTRLAIYAELRKTGSA